MRRLVAFLAALGLAGLVGVAAHAAPTQPAPVVVAAPAVTSAPAPPTDAPPTVLALEQIPIPVPPVVTGLPYPAHCAVGHIGTEPIPDPACTPGSVNPAVTQANIGSTICKSGWTATVRPPAANTGPVKRAAMKAYGIPLSEIGVVELDHLIPLETGGSDASNNLWPEISDIPNAGFRNRKDSTENNLRKAVCAGTVTLAAAQAAIAQDWTTAEQTLGLN